MSEVTITVSGEVGSGKSALMIELEIALKALGVPVRWADTDAERYEKNMSSGDAHHDLEMYKPSVVLVEEIKHKAGT